MAELSNPTLTQTVTECYIFGSTSGSVYATPTVAIAPDAQCYEIYPTGGGIGVQLISNSDAQPASTPVPTASLSPVPSSSAAIPMDPHQLIGAVVGGVVGILLLSVSLLWALARKKKQDKQDEHRLCAMGKWTSGNFDEERGERVPPNSIHPPQVWPQILDKTGHHAVVSGYNGSEATLPVSEYLGEKKIEEGGYD